MVFFSLVIGHGTHTGGPCLNLSQISWSSAPHFLKVEVKIENSFYGYGNNAVSCFPYALYAQKSLEPGPQGPKGEIGLQGIQGTRDLPDLKAIRGLRV